jgi:three-Cys-motif partner protein
MQTYLEPQHDGLCLREFGHWAVVKVDYLKRYIDMFETSMREKPWRERHYIELFAGSGKFLIGETETVYLGSPLVALTTTYPFTHYFFVDSEPGNISTLEQRCSASPISTAADCKVGDGNEIVQKIVEHIQKVDHQFIEGLWSSLNLAFLDPDGLELKWKTVVALASIRFIDLIIHYPQGGLNRTMSQFCNSPEETPADLFFGNSEWREIYKKCQNKEEGFLHRQLLDLYKENLQRLGYVTVRRDDETGDEPLVRNSKNAPLYRLLFASKHQLGNEFWQKVTRRDVYGQSRLF